MHVNKVQYCRAGHIYIYIHIVYFIRKNRGNSDDNLIKVKKIKSTYT